MITPLSRILSSIVKDCPVHIESLINNYHILGIKSYMLVVHFEVEFTLINL